MRLATSCMLLLAVMTPAWGAAPPNSGDTSLNRLLRKDAFGTRGAWGTRAFTETENPPWELDFGISYSDPQGDGNGWETPVSLNYSFDNDNVLTFSTGYIRSDDGSRSTTGVDDLGVSYWHTFQSLCDGCSEGVAAGVVLPSGGDVGSSTATQFLKFAFDYTLPMNWSIGGSASAIHVDRLDPGIDDVGGRYTVTIGKELSETSSVTLRLFRDQRGGITGTTTGEFELDFPVGSRFSGSFVIDRGFTKGFHDTSAEFDLAYQFGGSSTL